MAPAARRKADEPRLEELRRVRDRELELKRISGEISCSDCRRLKLKCDKKIPCSSCVRRGMESLCPLGVTRRDNGQTTRIRPASYSGHHSHRMARKLTLLSERIRALEDALALESEARGGSGSHPLLAESHMAIKQCIDLDEDEGTDGEGEDDQVLSTFGTLSIDESRTMRYLGPTASESALVMEVLENNPRHLAVAGPSIDSPDGLSEDIVRLSKSFPFSYSTPNQSEQALLAQIVSHLPAFERASALYEAYFRNLHWFIGPIERSQFVTEIVPIFYPRRRPITPLNVRAENAHDLALLYIVFACGSVGDLTQNPINDEAERYRILANATLSVRNVMHGASLTGVQAVFLLGAYDVYSGRKSSIEDAWKVFALGATLATAIGLHRDPSRWGFEPKVIERRRRVFWMIYQIDIWRNIETGRPSTFRPGVVDCQFPDDELACLGENAEMVESVQHWQFRFLRDIAVEVHEKTCSARPLKYRAVLELDRKIRDFGVHPFAAGTQPHENELGIDAEFKRIYPLVSVWDKEECLMYIHRNFFARAIMDFPDNPMRSPFSASFLTTYRSAISILRILRENMESIYLIALRIWQMWSLCLTCGVIVGAVASLGSSVSFATSAFVELEYAIAFLEKFGDHKVARNGLPLLRKIREKAVNALRQPKSRQPAIVDAIKQRNIVPFSRGRSGDVGEELLILRGTTRVIEQRRATPSNPPTTTEASRESVRAAEEAPRSTDANLCSIGQSENLPIVSCQEPSVFVKGDTGSISLSNNSVQKSITPLAPGSDNWLMDLEQLLGPSSGVQQSTGVASDLPQGWNFSPPSNYLDSTSGASFESTTSGSIPACDSTTTTSIIPDALLEQAVSTEDWRVFLQQSGFSVSPRLDELGTTGADTDGGYQSMTPMFV